MTFYKRKPILDVTVDQQLALALMYGAGPNKLMEMFSALKFSDGTVVSVDEIWTVNPMPKNGLSDAELEAVDLTDGDAVAGPQGETLRQMVSDTYHCENRDAEDSMLRRFLAS